MARYNLGNVVALVVSETPPTEEDGVNEKRYILWAQPLQTPVASFAIKFFDGFQNKWVAITQSVTLGMWQSLMRLLFGRDSLPNESEFEVTLGYENILELLLDSNLPQKVAPRQIDLFETVYEFINSTVTDGFEVVWDEVNMEFFAKKDGMYYRNFTDSQYYFKPTFETKKGVLFTADMGAGNGQWLFTFDGEKLVGVRIGIEEAPKDDNQYVRENGLWKISEGGGGGIEEAPKDGQRYCRMDGTWVLCECGGIVPPAKEMIVNPTTLFFNEEASIQTVTVIISGLTDKSFTVSGVPSWASITNKTDIGFSVSVLDNLVYMNRTATITVTANGDSSLTETVSITQYGAWLGEMQFKVKTTTPNEKALLCNMGAIEEGQAHFTYGDGSITEILTVRKSIEQIADDPVTGGTMVIKIGQDNFYHTYATPGEYTVTIKLRNGVDAFKFTTLSPDVNNEWYSTGEVNSHVTEIIKIQSDYIINASRMFAGVRYGKFSPAFVLECPNITNVDYMFEFFGVLDTTITSVYANLINYSLWLPKTFWNNLTKKHLIEKCTRMYNGSGFLQIQKHMLGFSTNLKSVLETFRGMQYVGNNWTTRFPSVLANSEGGFWFADEEIIETDLFHAHPNIKDFRGCFWWINDFYGNYPDTNYSYYLALKRDLFKYNVANNINISWMFRQSNRTIIETDFFRHIGQRIEYADGTFWGSFNYGGNPKIAYDRWLSPSYNGANWFYMGAYQPGKWPDDIPPDFYGARLDNGIPAVNSQFAGSDGKVPSMFPDATYPNMKSMVAFCGFRDWKRNMVNGVQPLLHENQNFGVDTDFGYGMTMISKQMSFAELFAKFPNVTASSGKNPYTGVACDGFAFCFWDFDAADSGGNKKASDWDYYVTNNIRPETRLPADMIGWGWGVSV